MLRIHDLNFKARNRFLLRHIDLEIYPGEFIAIVGPNGAGKSTLLSSIANEIKYEALEFLFKNKGIEKYNRHEMPLHRAKFSQHQSNEINLKNDEIDRKSTRLNSSHVRISYAVFCLKKKKKKNKHKKIKKKKKKKNKKSYIKYKSNTKTLKKTMQKQYPYKLINVERLKQNTQR